MTTAELKTWAEAHPNMPQAIAVLRLLAEVADLRDLKVAVNVPPEILADGMRQIRVERENDKLRARIERLREFVSQAWMTACDAQAMLQARTDLLPVHSPMPELANLEQCAAAIGDEMRKEGKK